MKMKKNVWRVLSLLLVAVMLFTALIGCKKEEEPADTETEASASDVATAPTSKQETEALTDAQGYLKDDLPETYDWQGREYRILSWEEVKDKEWVEPGEDYSAGFRRALYDRQVNMEQRFNIKFRFNFLAGSWGFRSDFADALANTVSSGADYYDLVGMYTPTAGLVAQNKLAKDLNTIPYINPEKPWWPQYLADTITIGDKLYFTTGGISPTTIGTIFAIFANLDLWDSLQMSDQFDGRSVFEVVNDGDWTLEAMLTTARNAVDDYGDIIVLGASVNAYEDGFFYGGGFTMIENKNGALQVSESLTSQRLSKFYDQIQTFYSGDWLDCAPGAGPSSFMVGKELFQEAELEHSPRYTDVVNFEYTALPMPKCDADQENYYSTNTFWMTMYSIPVDVPDEDFAGMILEGLASESYRTVKDAVYYDYYQARYTGSDDVDSVKMFDLITSSIVFDTARMFPDGLPSMFSAFRSGVRDDAKSKTSWNTIYARDIDDWKQYCEDLFALIG